MSEGESRPGGHDAAAAPEEEGPPSRTRRYRILVADDSSRTRNSIALLLRTRFDIELVGDGQAAMAAVSRELFDLIIADSSMPGLDGPDLIRELRSHPRTRTVPIVVTSARAGDEIRQEALAAGADEYIEKPFSAIELIEVIRRLLE